MLTRRFAAILTLGLLALAALGLTLGARHEAASLALPGLPDGATEVQRGAAFFTGADFGGLSLSALETHALPWKLTAAALVLQAQAADPALPASRATLDDVLRGFGFLIAPELANLPPGLALPADPGALGLVQGDLAPVGGATVRVANLGCAACHAGVTYRADGSPDPSRAWLGMPNTSLDLEAYTTAVFTALRAGSRDPDRLLAAVATLYPDTGWREALTLRWLVLPQVESRLAAIPGDRPLPFPNGLPGSTNGVAALKSAFGLPLAGGGAGETGFVSIPDLGHRAWRTSLLADGSYAVPGQPRQALTRGPTNPQALAAIASFFTVPSMGVHPEDALTRTAKAEAIFAFLGQTRPQSFPGPVDTGLARTGAGVYAAACADCHGRYAWTGDRPELAEFPNWIGDVGTDPLRARVFTPELAQAIAGTAYGQTISAQATGQYAAPPLTGLWASAPYLHNGSVPSIAALLQPDLRPAQFRVGGHGLDFGTLGLRDAGGFAAAAEVDTSRAGLGNSGHRFGEGLSPGERRALIEFLKLL
jgi:mono/diheme cytochrome c family protein